MLVWPTTTRLSQHNKVWPIWMKLLSCHALAATVCLNSCRQRQPMDDKKASLGRNVLNKTILKFFNSPCWLSFLMNTYLLGSTCRLQLVGWQVKHGYRSIRRGIGVKGSQVGEWPAWTRGWAVVGWKTAEGTADSAIGVGAWTGETYGWQFSGSNATRPTVGNI